MVNKAALGVLGVIVLVSMGIGVLIGMQLGGGGAVGGSDGSTDDGESGPTPLPGDDSTPTPVPTTAATAATTTVGPPTEQPEQTETEVAPARTTVPARRFDEDEIAAEAKRFINQRRVQQGLSELTTSGQTVDQIDALAADHSIDMADEGVLSHNVNGNSSQDRYRAANLFDACQFPSNSDSYLITAEGNNLEAITRTVAGRYDSGTGEFYENETAVAEAIVENWFDSMTAEPRLTYRNAERIGLGVEVTRDGTVYATADMC